SAFDIYDAAGRPLDREATLVQQSQEALIDGVCAYELRTALAPHGFLREDDLLLGNLREDAQCITQGLGRQVEFVSALGVLRHRRHCGDQKERGCRDDETCPLLWSHDRSPLVGLRAMSI